MSFCFIDFGFFYYICFFFIISYKRYCVVYTKSDLANRFGCLHALAACSDVFFGRNTICSTIIIHSDKTVNCAVRIEEYFPAIWIFFCELSRVLRVVEKPFQLSDKIFFCQLPVAKSHGLAGHPERLSAICLGKGNLPFSVIPTHGSGFLNLLSHYVASCQTTGLF